MKIIVTLLLSVVSFLSAGAARNLVPEKIRQLEGEDSKYYVVTGDNGAKGYEITERGLRSMKFEPGDTVYVQRIVDLESDNEFQILASKVSLKGNVAFIMLSLDNKFGLIELDDLERADMRTQEELAEDQVVEEVKNLLHGDNSYPYSVPYSLLAFLVSTVVCRILTPNKCCKNEKLGKIRLWGAVAILLVTFWFQYQLFVNGEHILSDWVTGHIESGLLFLLQFFAKGILLFAFVIWEIALMYLVLHRLGDECSGRTNYKFSALIWVAGTVAMAVVLLWFKEYSMIVIYVLSGLFVLDILMSLLLNRRNIPIMVATGALYGLGSWALIPTFANACFLFFMVTLCCLAILFVLMICNPPTVVGTVYDALGPVGELMSNGRVRLTGGREIHISNLWSGYYVKRNDD